MSIPMATLLTVANAAQSEIGQAVLNSATTRGHRVSAQALMYIVMLDAWHNPSSEWHTYVRLMPATHNDPLWWTEEERQELLQGTQLFHEAQRHMTQLREVYDSIFPELSQEPSRWTTKGHQELNSCVKNRLPVGVCIDIEM